jgi:hypothetical protein
MWSSSSLKWILLYTNGEKARFMKVGLQRRVGLRPTPPPPADCLQKTQSNILVRDAVLKTHLQTYPVAILLNEKCFTTHDRDQRPWLPASLQLPGGDEFDFGIIHDVGGMSSLHFWQRVFRTFRSTGDSKSCISSRLTKYMQMELTSRLRMQGFYIQRLILHYKFGFTASYYFFLCQ